jgi:hypothetical protein
MPAIAFWLAVLMVDRRWRDAIQGAVGLAIGAAVSLVVPLLLFSSLDCWWEWRQFASEELSRLAQSFSANYSLQAALSDSNLRWTSQLPWAIGAVVLFAFAWTSMPTSDAPGARRWQDLRLCLAIGLGPLWTILSSPLTWVQYAALSIPLALAMVGAAAHANANRVRWLLATIVAAGLAGGIVQRVVVIESLQVECILFWVGWISLLGLSLALIAGAGPARPIGMRWLNWSHSRAPTKLSNRVAACGNAACEGACRSSADAFANQRV